MPGFDPCCALQKSNLKKTINKWKDNRKDSQPNARKQAGERTFIGITKVSKHVPSFRRGFGLLTGFLTGHARLKYHLYKLGKVENLIGSLYQEELETRHEHFSRLFITSTEIQDKNSRTMYSIFLRNYALCYIIT